MEHFADFDQLAKLSSLAQKHARIARAGIERSALEFGSDWCKDFESLLVHLYAEGDSLENAVKGYGAFVMDSMRRQKRFELELSYPAKTYAEAAAEVYFNDGYMERQYLPGLLLSHYLWAHHYLQLRYFRQFFLTTLRARSVNSFAEVGVGTGLYSRIALQELPHVQGAGFDISPLSLKFTQNHVAAFGLADRYQALMQNILTAPLEQKFDAVVCVEVLEHLEDPVAMLKGLRDMVVPGGKLFVTAALNAAHADHIYLYRDPAEVVAHAGAAGLHVENLFFANAYPPAKKGLVVPSALAMVLTTE
jgi:SAM-dependent methyltransferase